MARGLAVRGDLAAAAEQIKGLYKLFTSCDCTMVEVSRSRESLCVCWGGDAARSHLTHPVLNRLMMTPLARVCTPSALDSRTN